MGRPKKADKRVVVNTDYDPDVLERLREESNALDCSLHDLVNNALRYYFDNSAGLDQLTREIKALQEREAKIQMVIDKWRENPVSSSTQRFMIREYLAARIKESRDSGVELYSFHIYDVEFKRKLMVFLKGMEPDGITSLMGFKLAMLEWKDLWDEINEQKKKK